MWISVSSLVVIGVLLIVHWWTKPEPDDVWWAECARQRREAERAHKRALRDAADAELRRRLMANRW